MKIRIKYFFNIFLLIFFFLFLVSCNQEVKDEYILSYSVSGNGYITCQYESGSLVKNGEYVNLVAKGNGSFSGWYLNNSLYDEGNDLLILMNKDFNLEARFSGTNYKDDTFTLISDLKESKEQKVCVDIVLKNERGYLVKDSSDYMFIYLGSNPSFSYSVNDRIVITSIPEYYEGKLQFTSISNSYKVDEIIIDNEVEEVDSEYLSDYYSKPIYGKYVSFDAFLEKTNSGSKTYFNLHMLDSEIVIYTYYPKASVLNDFSNKNVKAYGYLWYLYGEIYLVLDYVKESDSDIIIEDKSKLKVLYNEEFNNVYVSFQGASKQEMTLVDGFYEIDIPSRCEIVKFYSGENSTVEFNYDTEHNVFVLGEKNFLGKYGGYFTDMDSVSNEVLKITSLSMNDIHGYIMQDNNGMGGLSNASYIVNQIRNENNFDDVILLGNGDMFQGTAVSNIKHGLSVIDAMSQMDFDFMGIGNHEFDWGIEKIFNYFDRDLNNGEASFPLVNSNIVYSDDGKLVIYDDSNMYQSLILEKNGLKIGVISCIGDVYSSILYSRVSEYDFKDVVSVSEVLAKSLKDQGCDMILVNIHDGNSSGVESYSPNNRLAKLKYNGKYLIDIVINGHTHTRQLGYIERVGGNLPVIQCGGNGQNIGEIELYFDTINEELVSSYICHYDVSSVAKTNYDEEVEEIVSSHYDSIKYLLDEVYCESVENINSKEQLYNWSSSVLLSAVGADIGISNNGGLRSTGDIYYGTKIGLENLYQIMPFDNEIMLVKVPGHIIANFFRNSAIYYGFREGLTENEVRSDTDYYLVAVIDYVYYWNNFPSQYESVNTEVIFRDAMIEDLRLRDVFNPSVDYQAKIDNMYYER